MTIELTDEQRIKLLNSDDVFSVMQDILLREEKIDQEKEHFWMIGLAQNSRMQYIELVSLGSVKATTVEPMNVFRWAVMKGSLSVILVHNHPSCELKPTEIDKDITDRLIQVGLILNIQVIDHLIISTKSYTSFADIGLLAELEKSTKWLPQFQLIERIKKEEKKIRELEVKAAEQKGLKKGLKKGEEQGLKKGKSEMVKALVSAMQKDNEPIERIEKYTGLTREEIIKLRIK